MVSYEDGVESEYGDEIEEPVPEKAESSV